MSKSPTLYDLSTIYVELVCGTPSLARMFIFYFFIDTVLSLPRELARIAVLALFIGTYAAKTTRVSAQSIVRGQNKVVRFLGLDAGRSMRYVIPSQALKRMSSPSAGWFISLAKDTSLVPVIAATELTEGGREAIITSFFTFKTWLCVVTLYLLLNLPLSCMTPRLERRLG